MFWAGVGGFARGFTFGAAVVASNLPLLDKVVDVDRARQNVPEITDEIANATRAIGSVSTNVLTTVTGGGKALQLLGKIDDVVNAAQGIAAVHAGDRSGWLQVGGAALGLGAAGKAKALAQPGLDKAGDISRPAAAKIVAPVQHSASRIAREGIYEFTAASGKKYVGQSGNIPGRIQQHLGSGKLLEGDLSTVRGTEVLGGKTAREIAEQLRINERGIRNLENIRNPIGPDRQHLLPPGLLPP